MKIPRTKRYSVYKKLVLEDKKLVLEDTNKKIYYVYRVTDLCPYLEGPVYNTQKYYYGSRISKDKDIIKDFWSYCTSGKRKKQITKYKNDRFKVKILKMFNNPTDMIIYEAFLHQYFDVKKNINFFNGGNQGAYQNDYTTEGMVTVIHNETNKRVTIPCELYDRTIYHHTNTGTVLCFVKDLNEWQNVPVEKYHKDRDKYIHYQEGKINVFDNELGHYAKIPLSEYDPEIHKTYSKGKIAVTNEYNEKLYITTNEYHNNKEKYKTKMSTQTQMRDKNGNIINVSLEEVEELRKRGYKHMNANRSNCYNILTKEKYKEDSYKVTKYDYLVSRDTILLYLFDGKYYKRKSLDALLKEKYNTTFYKYSKEAQSISVMAKDIEEIKEEMFNEN